MCGLVTGLIYDGCGSRLVPGFQGLVWLAEDGCATVCGVCFWWF